MNPLNDVTDKEFIPFLRNLGVETYNQTFEWILNDPDFGGVMRWLYNNLDQNNALTAREEYRYAELEKKGCILPPKELESVITTLQEEFNGLCLPGDQHAIEDVKLDINMQTERLHFLKKQEAVLTDLIKQNELLNEDLSLELSTLNSAEQQCTQDMNAAAKECLASAEDVENITDGVIDVIANSLTVYGNALTDKETSKKFITFGPFDSYRQSQALFRSHFDLFSTNKLENQSNIVSDEDLRTTVMEATNLEERLTDAVYAYIESKAELSAEQAKLAIVTNYNHVHHSQITLQSMAARSAIDLLEQEETILYQQIQSAVKDLVDSQTKLTVDTAVKLALEIRTHIDENLSYLLETTQYSFTLDRLLYCALRHELKMLEEFLQFTSQLKQYVIEENDAVASRIESMNEICAEQECCENRLFSSDTILEILFKMLGSKPSDDNDAQKLVRLYNDLQSKTRELNDNIADGFRRKEDNLLVFKQTYKPLQDYIYDGCTKHPNCWDKTLATLNHSLVQQIERVTNKVTEASDLYFKVRGGDKHSLRKLWQWFLTDKNKLLAEVKKNNHGV